MSSSSALSQPPSMPLMNPVSPTGSSPQTAASDRSNFSGTMLAQLSNHADEADSESDLPTWSNDSDNVLVRVAGPGVLTPPADPKTRSAQAESVAYESQRPNTAMQSLSESPKSVLKRKPSKVHSESHIFNNFVLPGGTVIPVSATTGASSEQIADPSKIVPTSPEIVQGINQAYSRTAHSDALPWESSDSAFPSDHRGLDSAVREKTKRRGWGLLSRKRK
ncbi:hypothetical protein MBLNU459_g5437t1 [Dothideomycetes sp. NU459]